MHTYQTAKCALCQWFADYMTGFIVWRAIYILIIWSSANGMDRQSTGSPLSRCSPCGDRLCCKRKWNYCIDAPFPPCEFQQVLMFYECETAILLESLKYFVQFGELHYHKGHLDHLLTGCICCWFVHFALSFIWVARAVLKHESKGINAAILKCI